MTDIEKKEISALDTWPKVLKHNFEEYGDRHKAMRYKYLGIWQSYTWKDYYTNVKYLALGLLSLGFGAEEKLVIIGDNAPEWYFAELAAHCNHGISVGLYSDLTPAEIQYVAANSEARFAVAEDQEQVDKVLQAKEALPLLKKIIFWRYKGVSGYKDPALIGFREVLALGREYEKTHPGLFEKNIESGKAGDVCALVYTSGTTGEYPKGAVHSFSTLRCGSEYYLATDPWNKKDNVVSYLPPAWITEQWLSFGCHLLSASTINFSEGAETQQQDIREIAPSVLFYNPRLWERQAGNARARIQGSDPLKRLVYRSLMPVGYRMAESEVKKQPPAIHWKLLHILAYWLVFRPVRDSLGLPHARICYTTGATLSPDVLKYYHALSVPLKNLYGSTEGGALTGISNADIRPETVGRANQGAEIAFTPEGEIITRQNGLFLGYYKDPAATALVLKDGWFHTGDSGFLNEDGHLIFVDRLKDIIELESGDRLAPQGLESRLKYSPYIKDAWVMAGPQRKNVSAVIVIDGSNVGRWADKRKVNYTTYGDLAQKPEVLELVRQEIIKINQVLSPGCRVKKFINLHKEFDADESELTRNRKMRRAFLAERYRELVKDLYSDQDTASIESQIRYRDGRLGVIKTVVQISAVAENQ